MKHTEILNRAWRTVWTYRALWILGVILALVTFSWQTAAILDGDDEVNGAVVVTRLDGETFGEALRRTIRAEEDEANRELNALLTDELGLDVMIDVRNVIGLLIALAAAAWVVAKVARYVSETALIRMVDVYQETGERLSVRQGLRLGWSHKAWRLFFIDLLITVLAVLAGILLFTAIFAPLPLWVHAPEGIIFLFAFLTAGLFLVAVAAVIVGTAAVSIWRRLARQAGVLDDIGVTEAVRRSLAIVRQHLRAAGLTWLITAGVNLGWMAALLPLLILLFGAGMLLGGLPGLAAAGLAGGGAPGDAAVFVGLAVGLPLFLLITTAPLALLSGLRKAFISSLWTLTYRDFNRIQSLEPDSIPVLDLPGLEAASVA
jgi:hypothetical protein